MARTANYKPAPSEAHRRDLLDLVGPCPIRTEPAPVDPVERHAWAIRNPGRSPHGGQLPGPMTIIDLPPMPGAVFDVGVVLATALAAELGQPWHRLRDHLPPGGLADLVARHAAGDLGEGGRLDLTDPRPTVRSTYFLNKPGFLPRPNRRYDPDAVVLVLSTCFGIADHPHPELARTVTLIALGPEHYLRPGVARPSDGVKPVVRPSGIRMPSQ